jgi:hypothetical protein
MHYGTYFFDRYILVSLMPSKRCIQALIETNVNKKQYTALDSSFAETLRKVFTLARKAAISRAGNAGVVVITPTDIRVAMSCLKN